MQLTLDRQDLAPSIRSRDVDPDTLITQRLKLPAQCRQLRLRSSIVNVHVRRRKMFERSLHARVDRLTEGGPELVTRLRALLGGLLATLLQSVLDALGSALTEQLLDNLAILDGGLLYMLLGIVGAVVHTFGDTIRDGLSHRLPDSHTKTGHVRQDLLAQTRPKITSRGHHIDICGTEVYAADASQCDALLWWLGPAQPFVHFLDGHCFALVLRDLFIECLETGPVHLLRHLHATPPVIGRLPSEDPQAVLNQRQQVRRLRPRRRRVQLPIEHRPRRKIAQ